MMGRRNFAASPSITPRAPCSHAFRDWGRVSLTGVANVRSGARSSTEVPIINGQTRKVVKSSLFYLSTHYVRLKVRFKSSLVKRLCDFVFTLLKPT